MTFISGLVIFSDTPGTHQPAVNKMRNKNLVKAVALSFLLGACGGVASSTSEQPAGVLTSAASGIDVLRSSEKMTPSSDDQESVTKTLTISHLQLECEGFQVGHCFLAKEGSGPWKYFYDQIEGFDFQWGVESELVVEVNDGSPGMISDTSAGYRLVYVMKSSEQPKGFSFDYFARGGHGGIERVGKQTYSLRGDKTFHCAPNVCDTIESMLTQQQSVLLRFSYAVNVDEPLILDAVICADAPDAFFKSCGMPDYSRLLGS